MYWAIFSFLLLPEQNTNWADFHNFHIYQLQEKGVSANNNVMNLNNQKLFI